MESYKGYVIAVSAAKELPDKSWQAVSVVAKDRTEVHRHTGEGRSGPEAKASAAAAARQWIDKQP